MYLSTSVEVGAAQESHAPPQSEAGDLLVSYLEQLSIDYVFGVPGGAIEPLYNALARSQRRGGPRPVVARHEAGAAFMADGYAWRSGKLGVCCATTGPGTTNLITGVSSAYENQVPMLVITAQTALSSFGKGAFQESSCNGLNTVGMFQYCTRYNTLISHINQFERKLAAAIMTAFQSSPGPTHLSIPRDLLESPAPAEEPSYYLPNLLQRPSLIDDDAVEQLCRQLAEAKKVVFVIGDGCSEAIGTILEAVLLINATMLTTPHGKGLISPYHPLFCGVIGFAGHASARQALSDPKVDAVVAIGTNLGEFASDAWDSRMLLNNRLIHVESAEGNLIRSPMARLHVRGRILTIFERVLEYFHKNTSHDGGPRAVTAVNAVLSAGVSSRSKRQRQFQLDEEAKYCDDSIPIKPQRLMRELPGMFPPNTRYLADSGTSFAWAIHYLHPFDGPVAGKGDARGGVFRASLEFASMGWAIGSAVGTALASPGDPVVCITGDGALLMNGQEITVAIQEQLPVIFVVLNDSALGMVKHGQRLAGSERIGFELPRMDFAAFARSMGSAAYTIHSPQDLLQLDADTLCNRQGPTLLDVRIDPEEVPPMKTRMRVLGNFE